MQDQSVRRWIPRPDVRKRFEISDSTLTRWVKAGIFPPPKRFGQATDRWDDNELCEYEADPEGWIHEANRGAA